MSLWFVGAGLSIAGSIGSNLGINIQKYSFLENSKLPTASQRPYTRQPGWAIGLALVILGSVGDFAALALAAQSIITPIGSVTLVANMVFAHYWLKETLSRRDMTGTVLIIAGSVLTVSFGDHSDPVYSEADFRHFFGLKSTIAYTFIIAAVSAVMYAVILYLRPIKIQIVTMLKEYQHLSDDVREERIASNATLTALKARYRPWEKVHPFCYCALSGMLGAQSVLFGKMVSELISTTFQGDNQLLSPFPYIYLLCMLSFVFSQLHFLALALTHFDALYCVPIFQCFFILTSTIGGASFFEEFASFTVLQAVMFPIGIATTISGVFLLALRDSSSVADSSEGPGHHVIPASLATFLVDLDRQKAESRLVPRSLSHNWHHGGAMTRVQQDKVEMEELATAAALSAQKGEMKLSAEVEASVTSVMRDVAPAANQHKRNSSRAMSSVRTQVGGASTPLQFAGLKPFNEDEAPSPPSLMSVEKSRRKLKSRSHPTHFVTPSCLLPQTAVDSLAVEARATGSSPSAKSNSSVASVPALLASPVSRLSQDRRANPSSRQRMTNDGPLAITTLAREQSLPVPRHLKPSEDADEREQSFINAPLRIGRGSSRGSLGMTQDSSTLPADPAEPPTPLPGQMGTDEAEP